MRKKRDLKQILSLLIWFVTLPGFLMGNDGDPTGKCSKRRTFDHHLSKAARATKVYPTTRGVNPTPPANHRGQVEAFFKVFSRKKD